MRLRSIDAVQRFGGYDSQHLALHPAEGRFAVTENAVEISACFHRSRRDTHDMDDIQDMPGGINFLVVVPLQKNSSFICGRFVSSREMPLLQHNLGARLSQPVGVIIFNWIGRHLFVGG